MIMIEELVERLMKDRKTISTMESCTGGGLANAITNVSGASDVLKYSAVTYSNDFKIKMGVSPHIIEKYSVYSMETAKEMSKAISDFTSSYYGVGITGKLNRIDKRNLNGDDKTVYVSIYDRVRDDFYGMELSTSSDSRKENKDKIILEIVKKMLEIL